MQSIDTAERFGHLVRERRRALKLQQRELALAANVGERFIVDLEAGKPTCQLGKALAVAHALGIRLVDAGQGQTAGIGIPDIDAGPQRTSDGRKTTGRG